MYSRHSNSSRCSDQYEDSITIGQAWIDQAAALAEEQQRIGEDRASRFELEKSFPMNECHRALNEEQSPFY
jgi:hypothetical protein